jgi:hypothetical protein
MKELKPWSWRRTHAPGRRSWVPWIEYTLAPGIAGGAYLGRLADYIGEERTALVKNAIAIGKRTGRFTPSQPDDPRWVMFTKRTNEPKLSWLERQLTAAGIPHRRNGQSFWAPILEVPCEYLAKADPILDPVDDIPDDDPRWADPAPRYSVQRTDYKWSPCWGVFDRITHRWVTRDTIKRHCIARAAELNGGA